MNDLGLDVRKRGCDVRVFCSNPLFAASHTSGAQAVEIDGYGISTCLVEEIGQDWQGPYWIKKDTEQRVFRVTTVDPFAPALPKKGTSK